LSSIRLTGLTVPQPALRERKKKQLKGKNLRSPFFCPLPEQKPPDALTLSFHKKAYMPHRVYRGTKVYFIRSPHPCLYRGPPSGHTNPLGYFDRVIFFNYNHSADRGELGLPGSQGKQASQNR
jgi:hypothetical protein